MKLYTFDNILNHLDFTRRVEILMAEPTPLACKPCAQTRGASPKARSSNGSLRVYLFLLIGVSKERYGSGSCLISMFRLSPGCTSRSSSGSIGYTNTQNGFIFDYSSKEEGSIGEADEMKSSPGLRALVFTSRRRPIDLDPPALLALWPR